MVDPIGLTSGIWTADCASTLLNPCETARFFPDRKLKWNGRTCQEVLRFECQIEEKDE